MSHRKVVITGIGVVSPNGVGRSAFKNAVLAGKSGISKISAFDPSSLSSQIAGIVHLNGHSFSKKEEKNLPRASQFSILASQEALEDSALDPQKLSENERYQIGVFLGTGGGSVEFMEKHYQMYYGREQMTPSLYVIPASTPGGLSSELSIRFGFLGQSHVITTGCTSSTDALGYAFREIQSGRLDGALAGGVDCPISQGILHGFELMKILSTHFNHDPERASRPFSKDRDGFVLAEGSWMFLLEEKEKAIARGARIYSEVLGYGSSCEAFHSVRLDTGGNGNVRAISLAVKEAGISRDDIDYVNLHGTSTQLNDLVETQVMKNFFGKKAAEVPMSSTKSMIGHPQGASGALGLAATLLSMSENKIHPTINLEVTDPECDLDYVAHSAREKEIEYALCNTLGFGSKCSALVVKNTKRENSVIARRP